MRDIDKNTLKIIENIKNAIEDNAYNRKVSIGDPEVTEDDRAWLTGKFDPLRNSPTARLGAFFARLIAEVETNRRNKYTKIVGIENAERVTGGAIITSNHFSITDNTVIRYMMMKLGRGKRLSIVIQESNMFMKGYFGFLMRNCKTLPTSKSASYMSKRLGPAISTLLSQGEQILVYPEAEMWHGYRKPRPSLDGAYYWAASAGVPIIPCFVEQRNGNRLGKDGLYEVRHILHILEPIMPDMSLPRRERYKKMKEADDLAKRLCYEQCYGIPLDDSFIPERDIAGI